MRVPRKRQTSDLVQAAEVEQEVHLRKAKQRKAEADEERLKAEEEEGIEVLIEEELGQNPESGEGWTEYNFQAARLPKETYALGIVELVPELYGSNGKSYCLLEPGAGLVARSLVFRIVLRGALARRHSAGNSFLPADPALLTRPPETSRSIHTRQCDKLKISDSKGGVVTAKVKELQLRGMAGGRLNCFLAGGYSLTLSQPRFQIAGHGHSEVQGTMVFLRWSSLLQWWFRVPNLPLKADRLILMDFPRQSNDPQQFDTPEEEQNTGKLFVWKNGLIAPEGCHEPRVLSKKKRRNQASRGTPAASVTGEWQLQFTIEAGA
ncbi:unnamed protein product [Symbiodinium necroappetens]|uniref:Uncharacterized protein n=1 Tax=Symbiodinium necroappetens TaxID=1628268 RepID=A0A813C3N8_9DINO|nr:unnamed protein product [Symbiodinium necroappetens]